MGSDLTSKDCLSPPSQMEATDLEASASVTSVSCHGGQDAMGEVVIEGGVAPYAVDWGGFDPDALGAGTYAVQVTDANLCQVERRARIFMSSQQPPNVPESWMARKLSP